MIFTLAWRNVLRNRRRSAITVSSIAIGLVAMTFLWAFIDGMNRQMIENTTRYFAGDVQVHLAGYHEDPSLDLTMAAVDSVLGAVRAQREVIAASVRLEAKALASTAAKSEGIMLIGVDPLPEREVTFIHRTVVEGKPLAPGADRDIIIGRKLAAKLGVKVGEKVIVMAQAADGELATAAYRLRGIFATESSAFDGAFAFVTLSAAQSLLALGSRVSTINVRLQERSLLSAALPALRAQSASDLDVVPWPALLPQLDEMIKLNRVISNIILAVLLLVVATAVMNTVFMAVAERTREFGVMMALGTSPAAIRRMVVYETLALLALALVAGYGAGALLVQYFGRAGIDLSGFFGGYSAIPGLTGMVYPKLVFGSVIPPGIVLVLAGVVVSLYPAARAAHLDPSAAIRHV